MTRTLLQIVAISLFCIACASNDNAEYAEAKATIETTNVESPPIKVKVQAVEVGDFPLKITTNGTLQARQKVELKLETGGKVIQFAAREGAFIEKGKLLVKLDEQAQQFQLRQNEITLEEAKVNKADLLIANGGRAFEDTTVTEEKLRLINTLSGYTQALHAIDKAKYELTKTKLYAPFSGYVADVKVKKDQQVNAGETICTLINPSSFEAVFTLLEEQALKVQKGQTVKIYPLSSDEPLTGKVVAINPVVNEQGLVSIYARLKSTRTRLFEGMNIRLVLEKTIPNQIIIPKIAVVLRSGKSVVFTYDETEQLAKWNYVSIAQENDNAVCISEGLTPDASIIYEGNLNLDHDVKVAIQED